VVSVFPPWGSAAAPPPVAPAFPGETGPQWWSAGIVPSLFAPAPVPAEFFVPGSVAEEAFGKTILRSEERPVENGFFVPQSPTATQQSPSGQTATHQVPEPTTVCALLTAIGLYIVARMICRK